MEARGLLFDPLVFFLLSTLGPQALFQGLHLQNLSLTLRSFVLLAFFFFFTATAAFAQGGPPYYTNDPGTPGPFQLGNQSRLHAFFQ